jgi:hypothetical protein
LLSIKKQMMQLKKNVVKMVSFEFPASATYVGLARLIVAGLGRQETSDEESIYDLKLAVSEIASTLVEQKGVETIKISAEKENDTLAVTFNCINNCGVGEILKSRLVDEEKLGLLVDNVSIIKDDNAVGITLYKRVNA